MRIAIIGAGNVGTGLARRLAPKGHEIMLTFSNDKAKLEGAAKAFGVRAGTPAEAVAFGEIVVLAMPWGALDAALAAVGPLDGKIVWDCTNALKPDMSGLAIGTTTSGGETIAARLPGARCVKGIPPFAEVLHSNDPTVAGRPVGVFVAGEDAAAKAAVAELLGELPATVIDAGGLAAARLIEPAMMLLVSLAYVQGLGPRLSLDLRRQA